MIINKEARLTTTRRTLMLDTEKMKSSETNYNYCKLVLQTPSCRPPYSKLTSSSKQWSLVAQPFFFIALLSSSSLHSLRFLLILFGHQRHPYVSHFWNFSFKQTRLTSLWSFFNAHFDLDRKEFLKFECCFFRFAPMV